MINVRIADGVQKIALSNTVGRDVNWYKHFETQSDSFPKEKYMPKII